MRLQATALALGALALPAPAFAVERQLQLAARAGLGYSSGTHGGAAPALDVGASYGLNDAFSLYANAGYSVAFPDTPARAAARSPRHAGALSVGVLYAFDYLRIVPYLGLGARADVFAAPDATWFAPSVEARVGFTWLLKRSLALDLQAAYAYPIVEAPAARLARSGDLFTVTAGAMLLFDL